MNIFNRIGNWWDGRKKLSKIEFLKYENMLAEIMNRDQKKIQELSDHIDKYANTPIITKELALINLRLNTLELYVGLKREPGPVQVKGEARIS